MAVIKRVPALSVNNFGTDALDDGAYAVCGKYDPVTGRTYFTGAFSAIGTPCGLVAAVDETTGRAVDFPKIFGRGSSIVKKVISDGNGGYYIAGEFTNAQSVGSEYAGVCYNIVKIKADGTVDTNFSVVCDWIINDMVLASGLGSGTYLYIGGRFNKVNGAARTFFAAVNPDTGELDPTLNYAISGTGAVGVNCIGVQGSQLIIAGHFLVTNGHGNANLARLNVADGTVDTDFVTFVGNSSTISHLIIDSSTQITIAGDFITVNGLTRRQIAQLVSPYSSINDVTDWAPNPTGGSISYMNGSGGSYWIAGNFTSIAGVDTPCGAVGFTGSILSLNLATLQNYAGETVSDTKFIDAINGSVYVAGSFEKVDGEEHLGFVRLDGFGNPDSSFSCNIARCSSNTVADGTTIKGVLGTDDGRLLIYGKPRIINSVRRRCIAAFEKDGSLSNYSIDVDGTTIFLDIMDVAFDTNGDVYFVLEGDVNSTVNGESRTGGAATDKNGNLLPWNPNLETYAQPVCLFIKDSLVYLGGYLYSVGGDSSYEYFAVTHKSTGTLEPLSTNPAPDDAVLSIAVTDSRIYICGYFTQVQGTGGPFDCGGFAELSLSGVDQGSWEVSGSVPVAGGPSVNRIRLTRDQSTLYVGGYFTSVLNNDRNGAFAIDTSSRTVLPWNPDFDMGVETLDLAWDEQSVLISGYRSTFIPNFNSINQIVEVDPTTGEPIDGLLNQDFTGGANVSYMSQMARTPNFLYLFGEFMATNSAPISEGVPNQQWAQTTIYPGGQIASNIGIYPLITALNLVGTVEATSGKYQPLAEGDLGTDTAGTPIMGATGLLGITGLSGSTGSYVFGATGASPRGATGILGATGIRGITGLRGATGIQGLTGTQGLALQGHTGIVSVDVMNYYWSGDSNEITLTAANTQALIDTFESPVTVTLPLAADAGPGRFFYIQDVGSYPDGVGFSGNPVTVVTSGEDTINGGSSVILATWAETVIIISNGVDKYTLSVPRSQGPRGATGI